MATIPVVSRCTGRKPPSDIRIEGDVAIITLTRGFCAIVDISDLAEVAGYRWSTHTTNAGHAYASRYEHGKCILMHRSLLKAPPDKLVDHVDGDGLNNRRANIRLATPAQNMANKVVERRNQLGIKGVSLSDTKKQFRATITPNGRKISLGQYATAAEAAAAYRGAATILWGKFAHK